MTIANIAGSGTLSPTSQGSASTVTATGQTDDTVSENAPVVLAASAGQTTAIAGVQIVDDGLNGETFTTVVTANSGVVTASGTAVSGSGTQSVTVTGTLAQVNAALATLAYSNPNLGGDNITVSTTDLADQSTAQKNISVLVHPDSATNPVAYFLANQSALDSMNLGIAIADTATNIGANFAALAGDSHISSITVTDPTNPIAITATQYAADATTLAKIVGAHVLEVIGVTGQAGDGLQIAYNAIDHLGVTGQGNLTSYEDDYANGNLIGSKQFLTGITGQSYTGEEIDSNGAGVVTSALFTGVSGAPYSSYEVDYVGGVVAGTKMTVTDVPSGAGYSSYELDYGQNNAYAGERVTLAPGAGASYTGGEADFDASGNLSRVVLTGVANQAYSSLEMDYQGGVNTGDKFFYTGVTGQSYTGEEVDVSTAGQLEKVVLQGLSSTPYSTVEVDYSNGVQTRMSFGCTNVTGETYHAYQVVTDATGTAQQMIIDLNSGGHALNALVGGQILTSLGNDTMTGSGATTFALDPVYGADTITNFGAGDTVSLSAQEFAQLGAAMQNATTAGGNTTLHFSSGDTLTFNNMSKTTLAGMASQFTSHG